LYRDRIFLCRFGMLVESFLLHHIRQVEHSSRSFQALLNDQVHHHLDYFPHWINYLQIFFYVRGSINLISLLFNLIFFEFIFNFFFLILFWSLDQFFIFFYFIVIHLKMNFLIDFNYQIVDFIFIRAYFIWENVFLESNIFSICRKFIFISNLFLSENIKAKSVW
jgi:hypothetical protein